MWFKKSFPSPWGKNLRNRQNQGSDLPNFQVKIKVLHHMMFNLPDFWENTWKKKKKVAVTHDWSDTTLHNPLLSSASRGRSWRRRWRPPRSHRSRPRRRRCSGGSSSATARVLAAPPPPLPVSLAQPPLPPPSARSGPFRSPTTTKPGPWAVRWAAAPPRREQATSWVAERRFLSLPRAGGGRPRASRWWQQKLMPWSKSKGGIFDWSRLATCFSLIQQRRGERWWWYMDTGHLFGLAACAKSACGSHVECCDCRKDG